MLIESVDTELIEGLTTNCYLVADEDTKEGIVIDPGGSAGAVLARIRELELQIVLVVNTHAHFDHIGADAEVMAATGAPLAAHAAALPLYRQQGGAALFGLRLPAPPEPTRLLADGDHIPFGGETLTVIHTPGHTPGCISLYSKAAGVVFDGDVLFQEGIGRTDLPGGNYRQLMASIHERLLTLPAETVVYPGHGPATTIAHEQRNNPFLETRPEWP